MVNIVLKEKQFRVPEEKITTGLKDLMVKAERSNKSAETLYQILYILGFSVN